MLTQSFLPVLRNHPEQEGRPYRTVEANLKNLSGDTRHPAMDPEEDGRSRRRGSMGRRSMSRGQSRDRGSMGEYLPENPRYTDPDARVRDFTIEWTIELLPPEQARPGEQRRPEDETPEPPQQQANQQAAPRPEEQES